MDVISVECGGARPNPWMTVTGKLRHRVGPLDGWVLGYLRASPTEDHPEGCNE
jgi:hypothetical protein